MTDIYEGRIYQFSMLFIGYVSMYIYFYDICIHSMLFIGYVSMYLVGSVVEWIKHRTDDQHGLGSKPTCAILLCPWERHFTTLSPAWWSWQAVLNYSNISTKLLADSNILASPEAGRGNCLPYV